MALIYIDGWDAYASADLNKRWSVQNANNAFSVNATAGRNGTGALQINGGQGHIFRQMSASGITGNFYMGFAFQVANLPPLGATWPLMVFVDSGNNLQWGLAIESTGALSLYQMAMSFNYPETGTQLATYSANINANTWYYIEIKGRTINSISANDVIVHLNTTPIITLAAGSNTSPHSSVYNTSILMIPTNQGASQVKVYYDDLYFLDTTTSTNNGLLGDIRVECIHPTSAGNYSQFTPAGAASNYQCVNEVAEDGDTTYVSSSTIQAIDTYKFAALSSNPTAIFALQVNALARKDDAGGRALSTQLRVNNTDYTNSAVHQVADGYTLVSDIWNTNPNTGVAWTGTDVNNLEAGIKLVG